MNKEEERIIEITTIATYKDKIIRVDELLKYLFDKNQKYKEVIDMFLDKVDKNKMLLNNPDLLDVYLKMKEEE